MSIQDTKKILICLIFFFECSGVCNAFVSGVDDGDTNFGNVEDDRNHLKYQCSHIQEDELKVTGRKLSAIYVRHNLKVNLFCLLFFFSRSYLQILEFSFINFLKNSHTRAT